jgi:hypothetical protein
VCLWFLKYKQAIKKLSVDTKTGHFTSIPWANFFIMAPPSPPYLTRDSDIRIQVEHKTANGEWTPTVVHSIGERHYAAIPNNSHFSVVITNTTECRIGVIILREGENNPERQPFTHIAKRRSYRIEGRYTCPSANEVAPFIFNGAAADTCIRVLYYNVDCTKVPSEQVRRGIYTHSAASTVPTRSSVTLGAPQKLPGPRADIPPPGQLVNKYTIREPRHRPVTYTPIHLVLPLRLLQLLAPHNPSIHNDGGEEP